MTTEVHILSEAERLARSAGYAGFSYADLARSAGIRKPSVHHYFPTKGDLGQRLVQDYRRRTELALNELSGTAAQKLAGFVTLYRDALGGGETMCLCVSFSAGRDVVPEAVQAEVAEFQNMVLAWLDQVFREFGARRPKAEAHAALALVEGAQIMAHAKRDVGQFDTCVALFMARLTSEDE